MIGDNPVTLQLRYLQTLREIGGTQNSTIVFPMPIDMIRPMIDALGAGAAASADANADAPPASANDKSIDAWHRRTPISSTPRRGTELESATAVSPTGVTQAAADATKASD